MVPPRRRTAGVGQAFDKARAGFMAVCDLADGNLPGRVVVGRKHGMSRAVDYKKNGNFILDKSEI